MISKWDNNRIPLYFEELTFDKSNGATIRAMAERTQDILKKCEIFCYSNIFFCLRNIEQAYKTFFACLFTFPHSGNTTNRSIVVVVLLFQRSRCICWTVESESTERAMYNSVNLHPFHAALCCEMTTLHLLAPDKILQMPVVNIALLTQNLLLQKNTARDNLDVEMESGLDFCAVGARSCDGAEQPLGFSSFELQLCIRFLEVYRSKRKRKKSAEVWRRKGFLPV